MVTQNGQTDKRTLELYNGELCELREFIGPQIEQIYAKRGDFIGPKCPKMIQKLFLGFSSVAINFKQKPIKPLLNAFELRSTRTLPQKTPCVQAPR